MDIDAEESGNDDEEYYDKGNMADVRYDKEVLKRKNLDMSTYVNNMASKYEERARIKEE